MFYQIQPKFEVLFYFGHIKQKGPFKHVQNAQIQIILRMPQVSSGPLLSIHTFCSIQYDSVSEQWRPKPQGYKTFFMLTQLSMKFVLLINLKLLPIAKSFFAKISWSMKISLLINMTNANFC